MLNTIENHTILARILNPIRAQPFPKKNTHHASKVMGSSTPLTVNGGPTFFSDVGSGYRVPTKPPFLRHGTGPHTSPVDIHELGGYALYLHTPRSSNATKVGVM